MVKGIAIAAIVVVAVAFAAYSSTTSGECPFCGGVAQHDSSRASMSQCVSCNREFPSWMTEKRNAKMAREQAQREIEIQEDIESRPTE